MLKTTLLWLQADISYHYQWQSENKDKQVQLLAAKETAEEWNNPHIKTKRLNDDVTTKASYPFIENYSGVPKFPFGTLIIMINRSILYIQGQWEIRKLK